MYTGNKTGVLAVGFVAHEPKVRTTPGGKMVANFSMQCSSEKDGEGNTVAKWLDCVAWEDVAQKAENIKSKSTVLCAGRLQEREYTSSDGEQKKKVELVCDLILGAEQSLSDIISVTGTPKAANDPAAFDEIIAEGDDELPF